jgi:hypothetical protein
VTEPGAGTDSAARQDLAARQAELLTALLAGGPIPPGLEPSRIRVQAHALHAKRRSVATRLRPDLVDELAERFTPLFDEWATNRPRPTGTSFYADMAEFAVWLEARGHVPRRTSPPLPARLLETPPTKVRRRKTRLPGSHDSPAGTGGDPS